MVLTLEVNYYDKNINIVSVLIILVYIILRILFLCILILPIFRMNVSIRLKAT